MAARLGRPAVAEPLSEKIEFRVTIREKRRIAEIAELNGQDVTDFVRDAVREAAADCDDQPVLRPASTSRQTENQP